jgi:D-glycero-alpha-D-manno-heptose-7-phosphate kinase
MALDVTVASEMPPGASTGTSASLVVALLAALAHLRGESPTPADLARAAHRLETDHLGLQSGVQDQLAAAYGGINFIEIPSYPETRVLPVSVHPEIRATLDDRLVLIYLGRAHRSSDVHNEVIRAIADGSSGSSALDALRRAAVRARDALTTGDIEAFAAALTANTIAQQQLHPSLVGAEATRLIAAAGMIGASGWKINGAGGAGGSVTLVLGPEEPSIARARLLDQVSTLLPGAREIPMRLSARGAAIESSPG